MTPAAAIAMLDSALLRAGQTLTLRRVTGAPPSLTNIDLNNVPAMVRSYQPTELVGGISQTDSFVIISPTSITGAGWPAGQVASGTVADPTLPKKNDKLIIAGRMRNVEVVDPIYIGATLVRIEMRVSG